MSKLLIAGLVAQKHGVTRAQAEEIVQTVLQGIQDTLVTQGTISFLGFGRFLVEDRAARPGRNPGTGESVEIPARRVVKFKPSEPFKAAINRK